MHISYINGWKSAPKAPKILGFYVNWNYDLRVHPCDKSGGTLTWVSISHALSSSNHYFYTDNNQLKNTFFLFIVAKRLLLSVSQIRFRCYGSDPFFQEAWVFPTTNSRNTVTEVLHWPELLGDSIFLNRLLSLKEENSTDPLILLSNTSSPS